VKKSFNIQELLHYKSKRHETKLMRPSSSRAFQRDQESDLKHPSLVDLIGTNKTNKQPSFINRFPCPPFLQELHNREETMFQISVQVPNSVAPPFMRSTIFIIDPKHRIPLQSSLQKHWSSIKHQVS
jgi:hypothetical protein